MEGVVLLLKCLANYGPDSNVSLHLVCEHSLCIRRLDFSYEYRIVIYGRIVRHTVLAAFHSMYNQFPEFEPICQGQKS